MQYGPVTTSLWSSTFSFIEFAVLIASLTVFVSCPNFFTGMTYNLLGWCKIIALKLSRCLGRSNAIAMLKAIDQWKGGRIDTYSFVWHQSCCSCISQLHQFLITSSTNITGFSGGTSWEHAKTSPEKCSNSLHNLMCPAADTRLDLLLGVCFVFPNGGMSILKFHPQWWIG